MLNALETWFVSQRGKGSFRPRPLKIGDKKDKDTATCKSSLSSASDYGTDIETGHSTSTLTCSHDSGSTSHFNQSPKQASKKSTHDIAYGRTSPGSLTQRHQVNAPDEEDFADASANTFKHGTMEYYMSLESERVLIVSSSAPFHIQYANQAWAETTGWSPEEILGFDCKFLQGEATDLAVIRRFMLCIDNCNGRGHLDVVNYTKDGDLMRNKVTCYPVGSGADDDGERPVEHLACILEESVLIDHTDDLQKNITCPFIEIGMCLDRRDQCNMYPHLNRYPAPSFKEWGIIASKLTLPLAVKYMLEVQTPILITDKRGYIIHVNSSWCAWTKFSSTESFDEPFMGFMDEYLTEPSHADSVQKLIREDTVRAPATYTDIMVKTRPFLLRSSSSLSSSPRSRGSSSASSMTSSSRSRSGSISSISASNAASAEPPTKHTVSIVTLDTTHKVVILFPHFSEFITEGRGKESVESQDL